MNKRRIFLAVSAGILLFTGVTSVVADPPQQEGYVVKFVDNVNLNSELSALRGNGVEVNRVFQNIYKGAALRMNAAQATALARNPRVEILEKDGVMSIDVDQADATWGIDRIDQGALPLNTKYSYTSTGTDVTAYVIDTGILTSHSEFGGSGGRASFLINTVGGQDTDCNGHGTHVAGTIGGATYGVAKNVKLVAVKVLDCSGSGSFSGVISGMDAVASNHTNGLAVASMSLGGGKSATVNAAVDRLVNDGVVVVVAAGNSNRDACQFSPSSALNAVTVGATTKTDARASYSNFGTCLDIFAPGSFITSAWYTSNDAINTISGTSMAAPHVGGVVARILENRGTNSTMSSATDVRNVISTLVGSSLSNKVSSAGKGSPNKLLYMSPSS